MLVAPETEESRRFDNIRMLTHILETHVKEGKKVDYIDEICLWIYRVNSGHEEFIKVPNTCWDIVILCCKDIAPNLFKDTLPKDAYEQLLKVLKSYPDWLIEKELKALIQAQEAQKMHDVLTWMRSEQNQQVTEFRIAFLRNDHFIIHAFGKDSETLDVDLKYTEPRNHFRIPHENVRTEPIRKSKKK